MNADEYDYFNTHIAVAVNGIVRQGRFRGHVDREDLHQELWEWILGNGKKIDKWREGNQEDPDQVERLLASTLYNEAAYRARRARADKFGYTMDAEFYYTRELLEALLEVVYDPEAWLKPPLEGVDTGTRTPSKAAEGNEWIATLSDVKRAIGLLSRDDQHLLYQRYAEGQPLKDLARRYDVSVSTAQRRVEGAVRRVWERLGGPKWIRPDDIHVVRTEPRRRVMSNAEAAAITRRQWED